MKTQQNISSAVISSPTYNGFYFRNNIDGTSAVPSPGPYNLCPDIIQSSMPLSAPGEILGSKQSWHNTYNAAPDLDESNYYYLRGMNGAHAPVTAELSLYYSPAQLIMLPETWQDNKLFTDSGADALAVKAGAGQIGVTGEPFVWDQPSAPAGSDFYGFVAQSVETVDKSPVPVISGWIDMSELLLQSLNFGFRTTCHVAADAINWAKSFMLTMPAGLSKPGTIQISITANGFTGNQVALAAADGTKSPIVFDPFTITGDGVAAVQDFKPDAGLSISLSLQYLNETGIFPSSGSAITISASYLVPENEIDEAGIRGVLNHGYSLYMAEQTGMPVQQYALLGSITFVAE